MMASYLQWPPAGWSLALHRRLLQQRQGSRWWRCTSPLPLSDTRSGKCQEVEIFISAVKYIGERSAPHH